MNLRKRCTPFPGERIAFGIILLMTLLASSPASAAPNAPKGLTCELLEEPHLTSITHPSPGFGWIVNDSRRGAAQSAYQIVVERTEPSPQAVWDTGKVVSDKSINVRYEGETLSPNSKYAWKVRTWDEADQPSPFSDVQIFRTGPDLKTPGAKLRHPHDFSNRYPLETAEVTPVRIVEKGRGHFFVDFGRAAFATLKLTVTTENSDQKLKIGLGEVLADSETIDRAPGGSRRFREMTLPLKTGTHTYTVETTPDERNTGKAAVLVPPAMDEVMPFRYAELVGVPGELRTADLRQVTLQSRWNENASSFNSSSQVLNDVWELCKYSIKATSFLGVYVDGDRERIPYEGDAYINQLCHYGVDRQYSMARYTFRYLMENPTWPADWQMHMPLMAWADHMWTGRTDLIAAYYDDLGAKTLLALAREDGLIVEDEEKMTPEFKESIRLDRDVRILVDWPPASFTDDNRYGERDGYDMRPVNTVANAFHYRTLVLMKQFAVALGKEDEAAEWSQRAARVKESFQRVFFDPETGRYVDGEGSSHSALHANMFPLAFDLVPPEHVPGVLDFIESRGMACSVYGAQYLLDALYKAGRDDYALELLTATHDRSWAHMLYTVGSTITTEAWDNKYKENQDWNHAWGAVPANAIPRLLMGIEPLEPGFSRMRIRPQTGTLAHAGITTPTIRGAVELEVVHDNGPWKGKVSVPANTTAEFHVPVSDPSLVLEGGVAAEEAPAVSFLRTENGRAVFEIGGGVYNFEVQERSP